MIINNETGEVLIEENLYTLQEIWEICNGSFTAKKGDYFIYIAREPIEQYNNTKKVTGKLSKNLKYLHKNNFTEIYGWNLKDFTFVK